jgi:F-type H+-transporting ATPase subunit b
MSINLTLLGQMITFALFIWFTMRYVWPPINKAIQERQKTIADGLEAAEKGKRELELAKHKSVQILRDAKLEASHIIEQSNQRAGQIVEEAKEQARKESQQIVDYAQVQVEQMKQSAKAELAEGYASLVVDGAEKVIEKEIDTATHDKALKELIGELS